MALLNKDQVIELMELLKIPVKKKIFGELKDRIQNLIEENDSLTTKIQSKNDDIQIKAEKSPLEKILSNSGLEHLAKNIFGNLADKDAEICRDIKKSSQQILDNP